WLSILAYTEFAGVSDHATQMTGMALDVSERKRAELQLHTNERKQAYLLTLSDALRTLTGAEEIQAAATRVLVSSSARCMCSTARSKTMPRANIISCGRIIPRKARRVLSAAIV